MHPRILAIVGPTASGKTSLSLAIAKQLDAEIVSADSRQIYKNLNIGTAKPTIDERAMAKHHFVDTLDPSSDFSAGQFGLLAGKVIAEIVRKKKLPILVGGSGLYVRAALDGLFDGPGRDPEIRSMLEEQLKTEGLDTLLKTLGTVDPVTLERMKEITPRRVIRALEVYRITGKPISKIQSDENEVPAFDAYQVGLLWDRKELYHRVERRVDSMVASGLENEVKDLIAKGYDRRLNALNTVGYKEVFDFLDGILSHEEMIERIKRNSRRFAKRQMTWFRRDSRIHWISVTGDEWIDKTVNKIVDALKSQRRR
jgi:tRNA dimethylallyltransferase